MELLDGAEFDGQYETLSMYPRRWFVFNRAPEVGLDKRDDGNYLVLGHEAKPFTNVAHTQNTRSVGRALDGIYNDQTNRGWLEVLDWVWLMDDNQLRRAMQELAGESRASSFLMPVRSPWRLVFDRMDANDVVRYQRDLELRELDCRQPDCNEFYLGHSERTRRVRNGVWASPFYDYMNVKDDGNVSAATNSRIGFITGYDRALSHRSSVGGVFAYSNPEMKQRHARVKADDYLFGAHYNTLFQNRYELKLWGSYGTQVYRMNRHIALPNADGRLRANYTGNTAAVSSQISMPVRWREYFFRPLAALDVNYVQQNRATERGYEAIRLHYHCSDWIQVLGRVGVQADYTFRRWDFNSTLSYSCLFAGGSAPTVRNRFVTDENRRTFKIDGNDLGCSFVTFGLGARRWLNESNTRMLFLQYSGEYGRHSNTQTAMLGCQFVF